MKKILSIAILAISLSSCRQDAATNDYEEKDSLLAVLNERDAAITEYMNSFNDVERNLDSVAIKQHIIFINSPLSEQLKPNQQSRINDEITSINKLMKENRNKLIDLNNKLKGQKYKNSALEKAMTTLTNQLVQKEKELTAINERLGSQDIQIAILETSVNFLREDNAIKNQTIQDYANAEHIAYYVIGKSKDLIDTKIIVKKGGVFGMGRISELNNDVNKNNFIRIDFTQIKSIALESKDIKIITSHAANSYTLETDVNNPKMITNLVIKDPVRFWSTSKYLVIARN